MQSHDNPLTFTRLLHLIKPRMPTDVVDCITLGWVSCKNIFDQVFALGTDELWNCVVSCHDLLIQLRGIGVLYHYHFKQRAPK